jgi:hypothetical protein
MLEGQGCLRRTSDLAGSAIAVGRHRVLPRDWKVSTAKALRDAVDRLKQQLGDAVIVLAGANDGKVALVAGVSGAAAGRSGRGSSRPCGQQIGGKGGGVPTWHKAAVTTVLRLSLPDVPSSGLKSGCEGSATRSPFLSDAMLYFRETMEMHVRRTMRGRAAQNAVGKGERMLILTAALARHDDR